MQSKAKEANQIKEEAGFLQTLSCFAAGKETIIYKLDDVRRKICNYFLYY